MFLNKKNQHANFRQNLKFHLATVLAVVAPVCQALLHTVPHPWVAGLPYLLWREERDLVPDPNLQFIEGFRPRPSLLVHPHPPLQLRVQPSGDIQYLMHMARNHFHNFRLI